MRLVTVFGTRPEIIRLSRLIPVLDGVADQVLVNTMQNFDANLNSRFLSELRVRDPDVCFGGEHEGFEEFMASGILEMGRTLDRVRPDAFLVLGDTNTSLLAITAKKRGIPIYHMEAGHRAHDANVPEDSNRVLIDHLADFNLAYSEQARRNLIREGIEDRRICITGSPLPEVADAYENEVEASQVVARLGLQERNYFLVSIHRQENVNSVDRLSMVLDTLHAVASHFRLPIVLSLHPRTRSRIEASELKLPAEVITQPPLGLFDYLRLQQESLCVISDSGTLGEESAIFGFPAVSLRSSTERPEALESGMFVLAAPHSRAVIDKVTYATHRARGAAPLPYIERGFSERVANFVLSTYDIHKEWAGLR